MPEPGQDDLCHLTGMPGTRAVALCGASTKYRALHGTEVRVGQPWPNIVCPDCGRPRCAMCGAMNEMKRTEKNRRDR